MTDGAINASLQKAAKVVGFSYLLAMATGIFSEYARGRLIVANDAVETARNIMAHERLWRLGIASNLVCLITDVALIAALYVILERVNRSLAIFAAFMRVIETANGVVATLNSLDVLRFLSGADYLKVFGPDQLAALARIPVGSYGSGTIVTFVLLGIGSTVFCWLWLKSGYIPKALAGLGVVGSLMIAAGSFSFVVFPHLASVAAVGYGYMLPLGVFEVTMGFWLLFAKLRPPAVTA